MAFSHLLQALYIPVQCSFLVGYGAAHIPSLFDEVTLEGG